MKAKIKNKKKLLNALQFSNLANITEKNFVFTCHLKFMNSVDTEISPNYFVLQG